MAVSGESSQLQAVSTAGVSPCAANLPNSIPISTAGVSPCRADLATFTAVSTTVAT